MTRKTDLPAPLEDATPAPQTPPPGNHGASSPSTCVPSTSPQTIKTYNTELTMFVSYMEREIGKGLGELTAEDISLYREHLIGTYAAATAAKKLAVLRRFLMFTFMAGATTVNPESLRFFAKSPRVRQDPAYNVLTEEELSRMLSAARASNYRRLRHARRHGRLRACGRPRWSASRSETSARRRRAGLPPRPRQGR